MLFDELFLKLIWVFHEVGCKRKGYLQVFGWGIKLIVVFAFVNFFLRNDTDFYNLIEHCVETYDHQDCM